MFDLFHCREERRLSLAHLLIRCLCKILENSVMALKQSIGTQFKLGEKGRSDDLGTLKDVSFTPMKEVIIQSSGAPVPADSPTKFNVVLTFEIDGLSNDMGYYTPQLKDIGVGGTLIVKNKFIKTEGRVISLKEF